MITGVPVAENVPWCPQSLVTSPAVGAAEATVADLSYLLVEEIVRAEAHLQRWEWPGADRDGRLTWSRLQPLAQVAVRVDLLRWQLYQPQAGGGLRRRPRAGDVFAVRWAAGRRAPSRVSDLRTLFTEAYDVSADARAAAKLAFFAVQSSQLDLAPEDDAALAEASPPAPVLTVLAPPERAG